MAKKSVTKTKVENVETEIIDAEVIPQPLQVPKKPTRKGSFIAEDGKVNLAVLDETEMQKCREITKNLSPQVIGSVSNFGIEVQSKLADSGKAFLQNTQMTKTGECGDIMSSLLTNMSKLDLDLDKVQNPNAIIRVLQKIPLVKELVPSIQRSLIQYQSAEKGIEELERTIQATSLQANADNNNLQLMFNDSVTYIKQLESYIVAATLATEEAKAELVRMQADGEDAIAISDQNNYINALEKKTHDLTCVRQIAKQDLLKIRMIQNNNTLACANAQTILTMTVPVFRTQMAIAVALDKQRKTADAHKLIKEKTSEMIVSNAKALEANTIAITRTNTESIITPEAIRQSTEAIRKTLEEVRKIEADAKAKRADEMRQLAEMERNIDAISSSNMELLDTATKGVTL